MVFGRKDVTTKTEEVLLPTRARRNLAGRGGESREQEASKQAVGKQPFLKIFGSGSTANS